MFRIFSKSQMILHALNSMGFFGLCSERPPCNQVRSARARAKKKSGKYSCEEKKSKVEQCVGWLSGAGRLCSG